MINYSCTVECIFTVVCYKISILHDAHYALSCHMLYNLHIECRELEKFANKNNIVILSDLCDVIKNFERNVVP